MFAEPGADPGALERAHQAKVAVHEVAPGTLARVTATVTPRGLVAIAPTPTATLDALDDARRDARRDAGSDGGDRSGGFVVVAVGVSDPGNAGTLVRAAEAAGVRAVLFSDGSVDPFAPKCVRA
ncbi:hypothetical protein BH18ACT4_BH18ACT4_07320 [soil metagenome]